MRILFLLLIFHFLSAQINQAAAISKVINVGILTAYRTTHVVTTPASGTFGLWCDNREIMIVGSSESVTCVSEAKHVVVKVSGKLVGKFKTVHFKRKKWASSFRIKSIQPGCAERIYFDNLIITGLNSKLRLVNQVYLEHYVAGVVESEAGSKQHHEYYKVQSIICRTYALSNLNRHKDAGFHLCDQVHCQVYNSKNRFNQDISVATRETEGLVIVDSEINLITATFHSNCGGETVNSEDVWRSSVPYLRSICDTFCTDKPHAYWEKTVTRENWLKYLKSKYAYPVTSDLHYYCAMDYTPIDRDPYFTYLDSNITVKSLRKDWKLQSTYFHLDDKGEDVTFKGRGYGHGVGICQEGAMSMGERGFSFQEILHYYYTDVHLVDLSALDFFREN